MLRQCSVWYFIEVCELQIELGVFEARGVANFGTQCIYRLGMTDSRKVVLLVCGQ